MPSLRMLLASLILSLALTGCAVPQRSSSASFASSPSSSDERPAHAVDISTAFSIGKYEVTFAEWDACVADAGCTHRPDDARWGRGDRPVINVSHDDITGQFLPWLNRKLGLTGRRDAFRLPTEAEWEYAARAGTMTAWSCGDAEGCLVATAVFAANSGGRTQVVGGKAANPWGLHDMHGNVWEWTQDCYKESYVGAPTDGSAALGSNACYRVVRGGSLDSYPMFFRSGYRYRNPPSTRIYDLGFRLARTLP
jgi:formylglycine-generating enzyme required for sulfatase activity